MKFFSRKKSGPEFYDYIEFGKVKAEVIVAGVLSALTLAVAACILHFC